MDTPTIPHAGGQLPDRLRPGKRRAFLQGCTAAVGGLVAMLTPLGAGLVAFASPLWRSRGASPAGFSRIAPLAALPADGVPRRFTVLADRVNAWNRTPRVAAGAVYLRRTGDNTVQALNVVCPHAGCLVDYDPAKAGFLCPCHNSTFAIDGGINDPRSPSPRAMDELTVEIRAGEVWLRFQDFRPGIREKVSA